MNFYLLKWANSVIFDKKKSYSLLTFHCGKRFFSISLFPWKKGIFFVGFPFPHVGRKEIVFSFSFSTINLHETTFKQIISTINAECELLSIYLKISILCINLYRNFFSVNTYKTNESSIRNLTQQRWNQIIDTVN